MICTLIRFLSVFKGDQTSLVAQISACVLQTQREPAYYRWSTVCQVAAGCVDLFLSTRTGATGGGMRRGGVGRVGGGIYFRKEP